MISHCYSIFQRNKAPNEQAIPLLMPQHHMVIPHYMGKSSVLEVGNKASHEDVKRHDSLSSRSSFQDVPLLIPQEADEQDILMGDTNLNGFNTEHDLQGQPSRVSRSPFSFRKSKIEPLISDMPMKGFVDEFDTLNFQRELSHVTQPGPEISEKEWWEMQERGDRVVSPDEIGQVGPRVACRCQVSFTSCSA